MDWLQTGGTKYVGNTSVRKYAVEEWLKFGASDNHFYCSLATETEKARPVRYMEHKHGVLKQWDFDLSGFQSGAPKQEIFDPPQGCNTICENPRCRPTSESFSLRMKDF